MKTNTYFKAISIAALTALALVVGYTTYAAYSGAQTALSGITGASGAAGGTCLDLEAPSTQKLRQDTLDLLKKQEKIVWKKAQKQQHGFLNPQGPTAAPAATAAAPSIAQA